MIEDKEIAVYLGLGSNLDDPLVQVKKALTALAATDQIRLCEASSFYRSVPLTCEGGQEHPPMYINSVVRIDTTLKVEALLDHLQTLEKRLGRVRDGVRWSSRIIDLDILLYGEAIIDTNRLVIPHAGLSHRDFVLYPLFEIAPELEVPGLGLIKELLKKCKNRGIEKIEERTV